MDCGSVLQESENFWERGLLPEKIKIRLPSKRKKILVLSGPTGVGKTDLSLMLAQAVGGGIVSADSMQVYRGMDIGTAKVSEATRACIPHYLIDIRDIDQSFHVVEFWQEATKAIEDILKRGQVPIVVGGTGFYLNALLFGPPGGPPSVDIVRSHWEQEMESRGSPVLFQELLQLDPDYAMTITQNDRHKIVRALEIISLTQKKVSEIGRMEPGLENYDMRCWFLHMPRADLYKRLERRCEGMIEQGLVEEVEQLEALGLRENSSASQAIGYRQCLEYLASEKNGEDWDYFMEQFKQASRRYAKRQFTWFKKEPLFRWLDRGELSLEGAAEIILQDFERSF